MRRAICAIAILILLFAAQNGTAGGPPYKWTDEKGVVHFSDTPPPKKPAVPAEPESSPDAPLQTAPPAPEPESAPSADAPGNSTTAPAAQQQSPIQATHEMIFGKWKLDMSQVQGEIDKQIKKAPKSSNEQEALAKAFGEAVAGPLASGLLGTMRMEFTPDTVVTEMMGEKQKMKYSVVKIENDTLTLKAENKQNHALVRVIDANHITFQEESTRKKIEPMVLIRDDGNSPPVMPKELIKISPKSLKDLVKIPPAGQNADPGTPLASLGKDAAKSGAKEGGMPESVFGDFIRFSISRNRFEPVTMKAPASGRAYSFTDAPRAKLKREPEYQGKPLYGELNLGVLSNKQFPFVIDGLEGGRPVLYLDVNQDGDLTNDGGPHLNQGSGRFATSIHVPFARLFSKPSYPGDYELWFFVNDTNFKNHQYSFYSRTQLQGRLLLNGRVHTAYLAESGGNDADFTNDGIYIDLDGDGKLDHKTEFFKPGASVVLDGRGYRLEVSW